jgi:hypothetical protein
MDKEKPRPEDSPQDAEAKSKSVEERIPTVRAPQEEDLGPGEEVLQQESKAVRAQPRP